jgi:hypothetical protein
VSAVIPTDPQRNAFIIVLRIIFSMNAPRRMTMNPG